MLVVDSIAAFHDFNRLNYGPATDISNRMEGIAISQAVPSGDSTTTSGFMADSGFKYLNFQTTTTFQPPSETYTPLSFCNERVVECRQHCAPKAAAVKHSSLHNLEYKIDAARPAPSKEFPNTMRDFFARVKT